LEQMNMNAIGFNGFILRKVRDKRIG